MPEMTKAENAFFESGGQTVDKSLNEGLPAPEPAKPTEPVAPAEPASSAAPTGPTEPAKTPAEIAAANAEATKARQKLLADLGAVPLEALQEARNEGKLTKQELQALKQRWEQVEPLLAQLKPAAKPSEPNPYDPMAQPQEHKAYQEWLDAKQFIAESKTRQEREDRERQSASRTQQILGWADTQRQVFEKATPDFKDAMDFAVESRTNELKAIGMNDIEISQAVEASKAEIIMLAANRTMQGTPTNPAQLIYEFAKARGYKGKATDDAALKAAAKIQAGQQASGGLKGGAAPQEKVTLEDVARIDTSTPAGRRKYDEMWDKAIGNA